MLFLPFPAFFVLFETEESPCTVYILLHWGGHDETGLNIQKQPSTYCTTHKNYQQYATDVSCLP